MDIENDIDAIKLSSMLDSDTIGNLTWGSLRSHQAPRRPKYFQIILIWQKIISGIKVFCIDEINIIVSKESVMSVLGECN